MESIQRIQVITEIKTRRNQEYKGRKRMKETESRKEGNV
jgi:hypothetical protein